LNFIFYTHADVLQSSIDIPLKFCDYDIFDGSNQKFANFSGALIKLENFKGKIGKLNIPLNTTEKEEGNNNRDDNVDTDATYEKFNLTIERSKIATEQRGFYQS
jgi:hypothetical protein